MQLTTHMQQQALQENYRPPPGIPPATSLRLRSCLAALLGVDYSRRGRREFPAGELQAEDGGCMQEVVGREMPSQELVLEACLE